MRSNRAGDSPEKLNPSLITTFEGDSDNRPKPDDFNLLHRTLAEPGAKTKAAKRVGPQGLRIGGAGLFPGGRFTGGGAAGLDIGSGLAAMNR